MHRGDALGRGGGGLVLQKVKKVNVTALLFDCMGSLCICNEGAYPSLVAM